MVFLREPVMVPFCVCVCGGGGGGGVVILLLGNVMMHFMHLAVASLFINLANFNRALDCYNRLLNCLPKTLNESKTLLYGRLVTATKML